MIRILKSLIRDKRDRFFDDGQMLPPPPAYYDINARVFKRPRSTVITGELDPMEYCDWRPRDLEEKR